MRNKGTSKKKMTAKRRTGKPPQKSTKGKDKAIEREKLRKKAKLKPAPKKSAMQRRLDRKQRQLYDHETRKEKEATAKLRKQDAKENRQKKKQDQKLYGHHYALARALK